MQDYAVKAYEALRLESYARIDFLMDDGGDMYCLEANTLPEMCIRDRPGGGKFQG